MTNETKPAEAESGHPAGTCCGGSAVGRSTAHEGRKGWGPCLKRWLPSRKDVVPLVLTIVLTIVLIVLTYRILVYTKRIATKEIPSVETQVIGSRFRITSPRNGDTVGLTELVHGVSPFHGVYSYVVVRPLKVGADFVQPGPVDVDASGAWTGAATFGGAVLGIGELFMIRGLSTSTKVQEGPLASPPADAIFTEPVIVVRK